MNILVLAAHPDDETLGAGSTISKLSAEGNKIRLLTFTDGVDARDEGGAKNRNEKLQKISDVLGIHSFFHGDFPDNKMDTMPLLTICKFIEKYSKDFKPDIIFTHHPDCLNIDHSLVFRATMTAFRPQSGDSVRILSYFVPSSTDYNPLNNFNGNVYYNVEGYTKNKVEALKVYDEEMRKHPHSRSYENIINLLKVNGSEVGLKYAEKFQLIREVL